MYYKSAHHRKLHLFTMTHHFSTAFFSTTLFFLAFLSSLSVISGCSSSSSIAPNQPKEIPIFKTATIEGNESDLFRKAKRLYASGYELVASDAFQSLVDTYPGGPYTEFALLKLADATYQAREYGEAAAKYENFAKEYPTSPNAPYAQMRAGVSFRLINTDLGRDPEPLQKSVALFDDFLKKFPNSSYRPAVVKHLKDSNHMLAEHQKMIADFYSSRGKLAAANERERVYKEISTTNENLNEALKDTASKNKKFLTDSGNNINQESVGLANKSTLPPLSSPYGKSSSQQIAQSLNINSPLRSINCSAKGKKKISIELINSLSNTSPIDSGATKVLGSTLTSLLPLTLEKTETFPCFTDSTLTISPNGLLSVILPENSAQSWRALKLNNPPRILLIENS